MKVEQAHDPAVVLIGMTLQLRGQTIAGKSQFDRILKQIMN
tara:strand:- start:578 stop:700 length:123 start_codon:yes stop_codon:yes gene_type:complete